jgi:small GTP-binding protein
VKLQVWDTAGRERFRSHYKGAMGIILLYDCTEESTFNNISNWLKQIDTHASSNVAKVLVANKTDLPNRVISTERGVALAEEHGLKFFETSAKTGSNINEMFFEVAEQIVKDRPSRRRPRRRRTATRLTRHSRSPASKQSG